MTRNDKSASRAMNSDTCVSLVRLVRVDGNQLRMVLLARHGWFLAKMPVAFVTDKVKGMNSSQLFGRSHQDLWICISLVGALGWVLVSMDTGNQRGHSDLHGATVVSKLITDRPFF